MVLSRKVAITVDLEEWTIPQDIGRSRVTALPEAIKLEVARKGLQTLLELLDLEHVNATFFVTTYFAQRNIPLLHEMLKAGHEIGNHGTEHCRTPERTRDEWLRKILGSTRTLENSLGVTPQGYREPYFAITKNMITALLQARYLYDSSLLDTWFRTRYSPIFSLSSPFMWDSGIEQTNARLVELPISMFPILRIPVGWWWFRKNYGELLPCLTGNLLFKLGQPFIIELHSWELADVPDGYRVPFHVSHNCGKRSVDQVLRLIRRLKKSCAEFVTMRTVALEASEV